MKLGYFLSSGAGADELFVQQIGPNLDEFFDTWAREIVPRFT